MYKYGTQSAEINKKIIKQIPYALDKTDFLNRPTSLIERLLNNELVK